MNKKALSATYGCLSSSSLSLEWRSGQDILMATMLNGAAIMDGALLLIAANESCPQHCRVFGSYRNIGTIGHVAHGKSTLVKTLSGTLTVRFKSELERNITIKLGYANAKIYNCKNEQCPRPMCYRSYGSGKEDNPLCEVPGCNAQLKLLRHVSFVDYPVQYGLQQLIVSHQ